MYTDIAGYAALKAEDEQRARIILEHYHSVLDQVVAAHSGRVLKDHGNGNLCIFSSATEAATCSINMQKELQTNPVVPLRIGLHISEIFLENGNDLGEGVSVASRIQSLGQPNTVLLSKELFDKIKNHPEFKAVSMGYFDLGSANEPIEVYALANEGLQVPKLQTAPIAVPRAERKEGVVPKKVFIFAAAVILALAVLFLIYKQLFQKPNFAQKENALAVLYFDNMSGDPKQEYFCDGITEEIIARLSMVKGLRVKSRTSVLQYKNEKKSIRQIARELGVDKVLEGSIRKVGNRVRVTAQLIDASTDDHIWSVNYDRELNNIFDLQSDIAQQIAAKFGMQLSEDDRKKITTAPTNNTEAYDVYLQATRLSFLETGLGGTYEDTRRAIELSKEAIRLDPSFSDAYALLSKNYTYYSRVAADSKQQLDSAIRMAKKAIDLGPDRINGYEALGYAYFQQGNLDEALQWLLKCHELVPYSTVGTTAFTDIVDIYLKKNEYGTAMDWLLKAIQYDPAETKYYITKADVFERLGMLDSVQHNIDIVRRMNPDRVNTDVYNSLSYPWFTWSYSDYARLTKYVLFDNEKEIAYQLAIFCLFHRDWKKADSLYAISSNPDDMDAGLVKIHMGNQALGTQYLRKAIERRMNVQGMLTSYHYFDISRAYAALEDERYMENLDKAIEKGWHNYSFFIHDPFFDFVKDEAGFKILNQRINQRNERFKAEVYEVLKRFYGK
jgi:TolB-like protein